MTATITSDRLVEKTPEAAFLHVMQKEFGFSQRTARQVLETANEMLLGGDSKGQQRPGQVRVVVTSLKAPFGPSLAESAKTEVVLTVDKGTGRV